MIKFDKTTIVSLLGLLLIPLSIYFLMQRGKLNKNNLLENGGQAIGEITSVYARNMTWEINVQGNTFRKKESVHQGMKEGEKYLVYYDKKNPNNAFIDLFNPIYQKDFFFTACATGVKILDSSEKGFIQYFIEVDGRKYKRYQDVSFPEHFEFVESYKVNYNIDNPSIAYIDLGNRCNEK